jgi:hypothetical protein
MARTTPPAGAVERLAHYLLDGATSDALGTQLQGWLAGSTRFRAFAEANRDKIRKKLRGAPDDESRGDVRAELAVAHALLNDRRIELAFEAYGAGRAGPDFTVTYRAQRAFNLEVTRPRRSSDPALLGGPLLAKLRQLPPSAPNVVVFALDAGGVDSVDVAAITRALRTRADAKDGAYFIGRGFDGTRDFYQRFLRLGAVVVWAEAASGDARATLWSNPSARIAVPERAARACLSCLRSGTGSGPSRYRSRR